jgi:hypothetical protein
MDRPQIGYTNRMSSDPTADHSEPVTVGSYATEGEAEVAQARLRSFGIESAIADSIEGGTIPSEGADFVALQVRHADAERAEWILADATDDEAPVF